MQQTTESEWYLYINNKNYFSHCHTHPTGGEISNDDLNISKFAGPDIVFRILEDKVEIYSVIEGGKRKIKELEKLTK